MMAMLRSSIGASLSSVSFGAEVAQVRRKGQQNLLQMQRQAAI